MKFAEYVLDTFFSKKQEEREPEISLIIDFRIVPVNARGFIDVDALFSESKTLISSKRQDAACRAV